MATLDNPLLDDALIEDFQGVSRTINRPTKHAINPLVGSASYTWDRDINYVAPALVGSTVEVLYAAVNTSANLYTCRATSTDGEAFTRPTLNLVTYGGNTNNNIVTAEGTWVNDVDYDSTRTPKYIGCGSEIAGSSSLGTYLFSSADGVNWSSYKTVSVSSGEALNNGDYEEGRTILQLDDGRFVSIGIRNGYWTGIGTTDARRQPAMRRSQTSDATGTWDDLGTLIASTSAEAQCYHFMPFRVGDVYVALYARYVKSTEQIDNVGLWVSRDLLAWKQCDPAWYSIGASTAWDDSMVLPSSKFFEFGNDWYSYYTGFGVGHAGPLPRESRIGAVVIGKGRIAGIGTTGVMRLKPVALDAADALTVNCDASGGSLKVELLDELNRVIYGYSRDDCDTITTDTYGTVVTWAGRGLIASRTVKMVFVLAGATLHSISVGAA